MLSWNRLPWTNAPFHSSPTSAAPSRLRSSVSATPGPASEAGMKSMTGTVPGNNRRSGLPGSLRSLRGPRLRHLPPRFLLFRAEPAQLGTVGRPRDRLYFVRFRFGAVARLDARQRRVSRAPLAALDLLGHFTAQTQRLSPTTVGRNPRALKNQRRIFAPKPQLLPERTFLQQIGATPPAPPAQLLQVRPVTSELELVKSG